MRGSLGMVVKVVAGDELALLMVLGGVGGSSICICTPD